MAAHGGVERRWSDLPGDLLSDVYLRFASAYDRARFAAVCSTWRAAAAWHPKLPALPLLLPSTGHGKRDREARAYSPEDGRALRVALPWFPWGNWLVGSYDGGWIATMSCSGGLLVVNLFSGTRAARLDIGRITIRKVAFSEDPLSGGCILAAMASRCTVALHKIGRMDGGWRTWCGLDRYGDLVDIAFFNGELYGLTPGALIIFNIGVNQENDLVAISVYHIDVAMSSLGLYTVEVSSVPKYIFQLHGKLAIAVEVGPRDYYCKKGHFFRVFQLTDACNDTTTSCKYAWACVTSLGNHALFLGPARCKAVHVSTVCRRGGVEGNRIYYSKKHTYLHNSVECLARLDMGSCTVHCWENGDKHQLERIVSRGYHYRKDQVDADGCNNCIWLWPPDF